MFSNKIVIPTLYDKTFLSLFLNTYIFLTIQVFKKVYDYN